MSKDKHATPPPAKNDNIHLARTIGAACRQARVMHRLTQVEVARRIGVSPEFYSRMEKGKALPSVPTLAALSSALRLRPDVMLGLEDDGHSLEGRDPPEIRRLIRAIRRASPGAIRIVLVVLRAFNSAARGKK